MNTLAAALHDATHRVPGVPAHSDTPAANSTHRTHTGPRRHNPSARPRMRHSNVHHQTPPRILITWQNWIGRLVGGDSRR